MGIRDSARFCSRGRGKRTRSVHPVGAAHIWNFIPVEYRLGELLPHHDDVRFPVALDCSCYGVVLGAATE